jgi:hypothetical protein
MQRCNASSKAINGHTGLFFCLWKAQKIWVQEAQIHTFKTMDGIYLKQCSDTEDWLHEKASKASWIGNLNQQSHIREGWFFPHQLQLKKEETIAMLSGLIRNEMIHSLKIFSLGKLLI